MCLRNSVIGLGVLLLFISCGDAPKMERQEIALLEVEQLLDAPSDTYVLIDFRKAEAYAKGHIPGAVNLWRNNIEDPNARFNGMLAEKRDMEALLSQLGMSNEDVLVVYDEDGLPEAARLWWALKHYGFPDVRLLNGGLTAWKAAGESLDAEEPKRKATAYSFPKTGEKSRTISKEDLEALIASEDERYILVDARTKEEYLGSKVKSGAGKGGHIPTAIQIDWAEAIHYEGNKKFKSLEELERIYAKLDAEKADKIIVYCHSGVRSSHTYFVLTELLGYENVWNYDGSWTEWSNASLPIINHVNLLVKN